eukprot:TRINITY_DN10615_c0_g2_i1.p1 TRINITY_DN10615_c0_g2~~TRINITY_DN10615_c0_g2_i1.p1  ORF type:complete len:561 (-),score=131.27 TRINITY_DN10615_c0_g2_i1:15-1697(-)
MEDEQLRQSRDTQSEVIHSILNLLYHPHFVSSVGQPFVSGVAAQAPFLVIAESGETVTSADGLKRVIEEMSEQAPVGRGEETVLDTSVRNVLQVKDGLVKVQWAEGVLEQVLAEAGMLLHADSKCQFRAEFYKVLIYPRRSFFKAHKDHKDHEDLWATLSVDLSNFGPVSGGDVVFASPNASWSSKNQPGAWAAWFTSQTHSVSSVERGTRVVATYKLYKTAAKSDRTCPPSPKKRKLDHYGQQVMEHTLRLILQFCSLRDAVNLSQVCLSFHAQVGGARGITRILVLQVRTPLREMLEHESCIHAGLVLMNKYSFSGKPTLEVTDQLHGADRELFSAFSQLPNVELKVVPCGVVFEIPYTQQEENNMMMRQGQAGMFMMMMRGAIMPSSHKPNKTGRPLTMPPIRVRIAKPKPLNWNGSWRDFYTEEDRRRDYLKSFDGFRDVPENYLELNELKDISSEELRSLRNTELELDDSEINGEMHFPFRGVKWLTPYNALDRIIKGEPDQKKDDLWGNQAFFSLHWYQRAALLVTFKDVPAPERLAFAEDYCVTDYDWDALNQ